MKITLHQLNVFKTVAALSSVTKAAQKLHMTQPAVSNILKQLEQYYDCKLTEVIGRQLYLTEYGELALSLANNVEKELEDHLSQIQLLKGTVVGSLNVAVATTAKYFMPHMLAKFKGNNPNIHVKMKVFHREMVLERLNNNQDDFVVLSQIPQAIKVDAYPIYHDELVVISSPDNKLTRLKQKFAISKLANTPWIIREPGSGTRMAMLQHFKQEKFSPPVEMELGNNEAIKQAIIANLGVSIVSKRSIQLELEHNKLSILNVKGFPLKHTWYLVKLKGKKLSALASKFYDDCIIGKTNSANKHVS